MDSAQTLTLLTQTLTISRSDRWLACQRLQELQIPCTCQPDGTLQVEIVSPLDLIQIRSVVQQLTAPRPVLLDLLERCWDYHA